MVAFKERVAFRTISVWALLLLVTLGFCGGNAWAQQPSEQPSEGTPSSDQKSGWLNQLLKQNPSSNNQQEASAKPESATQNAEEVLAEPVVLPVVQATKEAVKPIETSICQNECEVGAGECTPEGARICKMKGKCAVWTTPYQCKAGQNCEDGRCKSPAVKTFVYVALAALVLAFLGTIYSYYRGLRGSPRELLILFLTKIIEYTAYGATQLTFVLFLSSIVGLSDMEAGSYIGIWSTLISVITMMVGALVDVIGIKRTLLLGILALLLARLVMPFTANFWVVTLFGFVPMAIGVAIMAPVISVGIKRYTTKEGSALGFGLFYTLMNVGWAAGAWLFDYVREQFGDHGVTMIPYLNIEMKTYPLIFLIAFFLTIPTLLLVLCMRDGVKRTEVGVEIEPIKLAQGKGGFNTLAEPIKKTVNDTLKIMKDVFLQRSFWIFMGMIAILIGVRLVFLHFHYTFPKYGLRVLGEGVKIGSIYGVLNPVIIVILVPIVSALTKKVSSYKMMIVGTILSAGSVFLVTLPEHTFDFLTDSFVGELVYDWWLDVAPMDRKPIYMSLVVFISLFTVGEAIWSPRLTQFTAEIAPEGREGTYISLSMLPFFLGKLVAGPLSGWLLATYVPEGGDISNHAMVWVWVGSIAVLSPLGLFCFARHFRSAEKKPESPASEEENA